MKFNVQTYICKVLVEFRLGEQIWNVGEPCNVRVSLALRFAAPILFEGLFEAMLARRSKGLDSGSSGSDFGGFGPGPGGNNNQPEHQLIARVRWHVARGAPRGGFAGNLVG